MKMIKASFKKEDRTRREHPRIDSPFNAFVALGSDSPPTYYKITVENLCAGGLLFSSSQEESWGEELQNDSIVSFLFVFPEPFGTITIESSVRRIEDESDDSRYAVEFDSIKQKQRLDDFLDRSLENPFGSYFLANDLKSNLREYKLLKYPRTKRLFQRIRQSQLGALYTFQQPIESIEGTEVVIGGKRKIFMSSYSYLGLLKDPRIIQASAEAMRRYGAGASGSRLLSGTTALHLQLEKKIARLKNTEASIVFGSGYTTNLSILSTLFDNKDMIFVNQLSHQSIQNGCKLSGAKTVSFAHNDMADLEKQLDLAESTGRKLIVTDAVFSMDGDIAPLPDIRKLAKKYNAFIFVDEAHSIGMLGKTGKGIHEHFGIEPGENEICMGTLSKAIPSSGGFIAGSRELIYYLKHTCHGFIFSGALSPAETAAAHMALEILEEEPWRVEKLKQNGQYLNDGLKALGYRTSNSQTAIASVVIGDEMQTLLLAKTMNDRGVFVCPVVFPAVPKEMCRIRNGVMATHTRAQLDYVLKVFEEAGKSYGII